MMFLEFLTLVLAGGVVGYAVGLTGVGGGSLMTPILLLMGYPAPVAIGTDLLYAGITKSGGMIVHHRKGHVIWRTVLLMAAGSLPASLLLSFWLLDADFRDLPHYERVLTLSLGVMLLLTSIVIGLGKYIQRRPPAVEPAWLEQHSRQRDILTFLLGLLLGVCVTLSSVGAGAFGAAALFLLLPMVPPVRIVGTDIAHAVPLTLVGGLGYLFNGLVDLMLLGGLLCGSLPGIWLGSHTSARIPPWILRSILVVLLFSLGLRFILGGAH